MASVEFHHLAEDRRGVENRSGGGAPNLGVGAMQVAHDAFGVTQCGEFAEIELVCEFEWSESIRVTCPS